MENGQRRLFCVLVRYLGLVYYIIITCTVSFVSLPIILWSSFCSLPDKFSSGMLSKDIKCGHFHTKAKGCHLLTENYFGRACHRQNLFLSVKYIFLCDACGKKMTQKRNAKPMGRQREAGSDWDKIVFFFHYKIPICSVSLLGVFETSEGSLVLEVQVNQQPIATSSAKQQECHLTEDKIPN